MINLSLWILTMFTLLWHIYDLREVMIMRIFSILCVLVYLFGIQLLLLPCAVICYKDGAARSFGTSRFLDTPLDGWWRIKLVEFNRRLEFIFYSFALVPAVTSFASPCVDPVHGGIPLCFSLVFSRGGLFLTKKMLLPQIKRCYIFLLLLRHLL